MIKCKKPILVTLVIFTMVLPAVSAIELEKKDTVGIKTGGSFEYSFVDIDSSWSIETKTTRDDNIDDDDTGECIDWISDDYNGIYSSHGNNRGFNHAWCVAAAECGPIAGTEITAGYTILKSPSFKIIDFNSNIDVTRKDFELTSAEFYFDYKFGSEDFSNSANDDWVKISSIQLVYGDQSTDVNKEVLEWRPEDLGYPGGNDWTAIIGNDYLASSLSFRDTLNDNLDSTFRIFIKLECKLIAGIGNEEMFEFFLKDLEITGDYTYDPSPLLHVPTKKSNTGNRGVATYSVTIPVKNLGDEPLSWNVQSVNFLSEDLKMPLVPDSYYDLDVSPTSGNCPGYEDKDDVSASFTFTRNMMRGCSYEWDVTFSSNGGSGTVRVLIGMSIWPKEGKDVLQKLPMNLQTFFQLFKQFPVLQRLLNR